MLLGHGTGYHTGTYTSANLPWQNNQMLQQVFHIQKWLKPGPQTHWLVKIPQYVHFISLTHQNIIIPQNTQFTQNIKTYVHLKFKTPPKYKNTALKIIRSSKYKIQNITNLHIGNITSKLCLLKTAYYAPIHQISSNNFCTSGNLH